MNHQVHSAEKDERNNESTIESKVQQSEQISDSSSDIFYNYESDSDDYYSLEDFDGSTKDNYWMLGISWKLVEIKLQSLTFKFYEAKFTKVTSHGFSQFVAIFLA